MCTAITVPALEYCVSWDGIICENIEIEQGCYWVWPLLCASYGFQCSAVRHLVSHRIQLFGRGPDGKGLLLKGLDSPAKLLAFEG